MRRGQGRLKHLSVRPLWVQSLVKLGFAEIIKIDTKVHPADLNTKSIECSETQVFDVSYEDVV